MSFEGIPRPSQLNPYADPMNPYGAAHAARSEQAGKPLVKSLNKEEKIKGVHKEQREHHQPDDEEHQGEAFNEEEAEQIRIFAKMRGIMHLALEAGKNYEFRINPETGLVDLLEMETGTVVLQLSPDELQELCRKIQRYAGMLTDRSG